jgi:hypothetical protein
MIQASDGSYGPIFYNFSCPQFTNFHNKQCLNVAGLSALTAWVLVCILFIAASLLAFTPILTKKYTADEVGAISKWNRTKVSLQVVVLGLSFTIFLVRNLQIFIISNALTWKAFWQ